MHFKDGREAKVGMACRFPITAYENNKPYPTMREGVIYDISPGTDTCNACVAVCKVDKQVYKDHEVRIVMILNYTVTLKECERGEVPPTGHTEIPKG